MSDTIFKITVRATSILIQPGEEAMNYLDPLINLMTYEDEFIEETKTLGFLYDKETDTLYIHKGVDIQYLNKLLPHSKIIMDEYHPFKNMKFEYEEVIPPRNIEQEDVINFIAGLNHHSENLNSRQLFLVKDPGFGKAQPYSTKIPTPTKRGYTLLGDLKTGDYVYDRTGNRTEVVRIFEQGKKDVYEITFEDNRKAYCCDEHLWPTYENGDNYNIRKTFELMDGIGYGDEYEIPLCDPVYDWLICANLSRSIYKDLPLINVRSGCIQVDSLRNRNKHDKYIKEQLLPALYSLGYVAYFDEDDFCVYYNRQDRLKIKSIKYSHKSKCRCILVNNPEHLYLTENFIVTHNTYCSGSGLCQFGVKTLIIMHRDSLRTQWVNSLFNMNGLTADYVHEISSSEELYDIANGNIELDYDVYLLTHATFRAGVKRIKSMSKIGNITKNLGIGLKIIDEAHLEFRDTLLMDFCFNVKRNLYLTATDARSAKEENTIFRHVFSNATFYKPSALLSSNVPKKWVEYISVGVNTNVKRAVYQYRIIGGRGMNQAVYGKWVIKKDKQKRHFKCCRDILKMVYEKDPHAKVLVFMPLIELCGEAAYFFNKELNYDETFEYDLNIKTINSSNSKRENEDNKHADVIVTTIGSCGTGTDIPGITTIISCSPFVSRVTAKQCFGRLRYCGKICQYYDIFDQSVPMDFFWLKSRRKTLKQLALNVKHFDWSE